MTIDALLSNRMYRHNKSELARALNINRATLNKYIGDTEGKHHFVRCVGEDCELFTNQSNKVETTDKESKRLVEVCDDCGCASCWHGEFMCDDNKTASTMLKTVAVLDKLSIENKEHYSKERLFKIYGVCAPHGYHKD